MVAFIGAAAFNGVRATSTQVCRATSTVSMAQSKAVPFLPQPANLDGSMAGDVGFDPLGFSNMFDVKFLREAELKHGRICMLAALGWLVQEFYTFPFYPGAPKLATDAHDFFVQLGSLNQILIFASFFEIVAGVPGILQTMQGSGREPGYFAFDPLKLAKDDNSKYALSEVKNGRLAMIAVGGFVHQAWLTKMPVIEQLTNGKFLP
mmetsp:Transcript_17401/g.37785  ORF Transcript_17401/g.37785 Transcript_17401/m.37785 type:complete len:206 (-) Transcript_17401:82-699(-)|eukprot:CAMPEP_0185846528 /NCGR_PEP_ID=MMETSP1354-20130828/2128_1 /TAXON_ID=708628 /ORGANISM="Erythrolobus madagascarensis, Strain CCMP3276" /LENGTH=205 /DNA_ID=CAMNT_0028546667 /DNA_START=79 /DNA_END=696 /DNA_ORIENTATION=-